MPRRSRFPVVLQTLPSLVVLLGLLCLAIGAEGFTARAIGIVDGDTIDVLHGSHPVRVRLNGIDAPERGQLFSARAKQVTALMAFGQFVEVVERDHDRYGRTIADVQLPDGRSLNHELVRAGYAWWFRKFQENGESH